METTRSKKKENGWKKGDESKKIQITKTIINNVYTKLSNKKINKLKLSN